MEELIWSGKGGWLVLRRVAGVHYVYYIGEKDCTARFVTGAIWEIPDKKLNQVAPATQAGLYRRGPLYVVYFLYGLHDCLHLYSVQYTRRQQQQQQFM